MDKEIWNKIYRVQNAAAQDEEYVALHGAYVPEQERFTDLYLSLPQEQQKIIEKYLETAVALHHRLMGLACEWNEEERNAPLA